MSSIVVHQPAEITSVECPCRAKMNAALRVTEAIARSEGRREAAERMRSLRERRSHSPGCRNFVEWRDMKSFVYIAQAGHRGPVKIGKSDDPYRRIQKMQTSHYQTLHFLGRMRGGAPLEKYLHDLMYGQHMRGEWFAPTFIVLTFVGALLRYGLLKEGTDLAKLEWCWTESVNPEQS